MAYTINKTSGAVLTTVSDGTIDNSTSLTLVGKNYAGYGEFLNENFVKLLENFSNTTAPVGPQTGQLWWDSTASKMKVYQGSNWKQYSNSYVGPETPTSPVAGDTWWDTASGKLKIYDISGAFKEIGGPGTATQVGSTVAVDTVNDTVGSSHNVIKFSLGGTVVAILSKDTTFTPNPAIPGFATIIPGMNLANSSVISGIQLTGTSSNAEMLDNTNSTSFMRKNTNESTTGTLSVLNDTGMTVGVDSDFSVYVSGSDVFLRNQTSNGDINFRVNKAGTATTVLNLDGSTGTLFPGANDTYNIGSSTMRFATIFATTFYGTANQALYADLAERFASDSEYVPGTLVKIGGTKEVTVETADLSEDVFGVISTDPAYLMNSGAGGNATHPPIAMTGRVPVRVIGAVKKGDRLVSAGNGRARAAQRSEITAFNVIGRSLEDKTSSGESLVMAIVKINS